MKHELIQTENYLLIVDDSEIKVGDWCIMFDSVGNVFSNPQQYTNPETQHLNKGLKKITAHLPLNGAPVLEGVDLLPPIEDDEVEKLAEQMFTNEGVTTFVPREIWKDGYNKAKEKYKYTEEDLMEAMLQISEYYADNLNKDMDGHKKSLDIIQSLQQPKMPVGFECESDYIGFQDEGDLKVPQSFINSQGQTVWVGKYIFND